MSIAETIAARSPFYRADDYEIKNGRLEIDRTVAKDAVMEAKRSDGDRPHVAAIDEYLRKGRLDEWAGEIDISDEYVRDAAGSFITNAGTPVTVTESAVPFDPSEIDNAATDALQFDTIKASFEGDADVFTSADASALLDDRLFIVNGTGEQSSVSLYETEARENLLGTVNLRDAGNVGEFVDRLRTTTTDNLDALGIEATEVSQATQDRRTRSELRNELDATLEAEGYDADRWNTDARADGTLIIQDPDSNKTETIEPGQDADTFNPDTFDTNSGTESPIPAPESNSTGATAPDMPGLNRPRVIAAILGVIALIYGATQ